VPEMRGGWSATTLAAKHMRVFLLPSQGCCSRATLLHALRVVSPCRCLAEDSLALLVAALPGPAAAWPQLFSLRTYGEVIGMFELNNLGLAVPSPVEDYFLMVRTCEGRLVPIRAPWLLKL
jgi:hypothetical protein